jgi:8-oxo-dGTP diphosphatase
MYPFNVRVYGLLIESDSILITHETIKGFNMTKFPGGGLEFGEGTMDCLIREFKEELNLDITVKDHFYTTDIFQASAFNPSDQIISIYYLVERNSLNSIELTEEEIVRSISWKNINSLESERLSFPIDRLVLELLKKENLDS